MKYNVYLLSYNNYNNRQVKKLDTLQDYINGGYVLNTVENVNFEMADGIASTLIVNYQYVTAQPDYCIIEDRTTHEFSRWFIIDSDLVRGAQYHFTVKRDIWVDHYDLAMNSTYFIERGYVNPADDLIFNDEGQKYSQIKRDQTSLYDETGVPWIVGYIARNAAGSTSSKWIKESAFAPDGSTGIDISVAGIETWDYYDYVTSNPNHISLFGDNVDSAYRCIVKLPTLNTVNAVPQYKEIYLNIDLSNKVATDSDSGLIDWFSNNNAAKYTTGVYHWDYTETLYNSYKSSQGWYNETVVGYATYLSGVYNSLISGTVYQLNNNALAYSQMLTALRGIHNPDNDTVNYVKSLNGKVIKDTNTGKVYRIALNDRILKNTFVQSSIPDNVFTRVRFLLDLDSANQFGTTTNHVVTVEKAAIEICNTEEVIQIVLNDVGNVSTWLPGDDAVNSSGMTTSVNRQHLTDAPYDMFAIPYGPLQVKYGNDTYTCNKDLAMLMANAFATTLADKLYDMQIVPYCPVRDYIKNDGTFDITGETLGVGGKRVRKIVYSTGTETENDNPLGFVFYCSRSVENDIVLRHKVGNELVTYDIQIDDIKKSYNTEFYRLTSPNYAASFEFSPAQNNGVLQFEMSFTYKPYNPYIKVKPHFNRLFGGNFQDPRGLICQGDFSLPAMLNKWQEYEIQNKNYLNAFNREIVSMKTQQGIEYEEALWKAGFGQLGGAVAGGIAGGSVGGPWGAAIGAGVGLIGSGLAAERDLKNLRTLHNDTIDKARTLFAYNLENIKALPNTIRNVGCLTNDNVLVPVLEYFTASDDEIDAFEKKIQYYGMSVMKVGKVVDYLNPIAETFIQGSLLRLLPPEGVITEADNHLAEELSSELQKGLYIGGN